MDGWNNGFPPSINPFAPPQKWAHILSKMAFDAEKRGAILRPVFYPLKEGNRYEYGIHGQGSGNDHQCPVIG